MTGPEFAAIRKRLGLSVIEFGRALGYEGEDNTVSVTVRRYEAPNGRPIPLDRLARDHVRSLRGARRLPRRHVTFRGTWRALVELRACRGRHASTRKQRVVCH